MTQQNQTEAAKPAEADKKAKPKTVKIRTLRPVSGRVWDAKASEFVDQIVEKGNVVEMHPDDAKILVETKFRGHLQFAGERWNDKTQHDYRRAEYVTVTVPA